MLNLKLQAARADMRVCEDLFEVIHRCAGYAGVLETLEQLATVPFQEQSGQDRQILGVYNPVIVLYELQVAPRHLSIGRAEVARFC